LGREVEAALEVLGQGTVLVTSSPPRSRVPPLVPWPLGGSAIRTMSAFLQAAFLPQQQAMNLVMMVLPFVDFRQTPLPYPIPNVQACKCTFACPCRKCPARNLCMEPSPILQACCNQRCDHRCSADDWSKSHCLALCCLRRGQTICPNPRQSHRSTSTGGVAGCGRCHQSNSPGGKAGCSRMQRWRGRSQLRCEWMPSGHPLLHRQSGPHPSWPAPHTLCNKMPRMSSIRLDMLHSPALFLTRRQASPPE